MANGKYNIIKFRGKYPYKQKLPFVTGYTNAGHIIKVIGDLKYYGDKLLISELENLYHKGFTHVIVTL